MAAAVSTKKKKAKHPKGFAQLPEWWMEITPHDTLDVEEDSVKRKHANQEAVMYRNLAAKSDWEQLNGDSKYSLGENGELIDKETGKVIETGGDNSSYKRDEKTGEWLKDGEPIFKGLQPNYTAGGGGLSPSSGGPEYGHKDIGFKKPDWMKVKLKTTGTGDTIRKGDYSQFEG
eukprot:CAMPEP_0170896122 /NCGR_PEP_ID=MMETSP0734-20130129/44584_1 /TAXON_ID=186038 /ORGANISM="Fragilariopsis kerguelensis, Strain L26-C5" /LENGTH=173 /DNA_ID=CAMNT_0011288259 /DNA_START=25 /DNA_END=546 /DNA_ORIENTATION=-